jgi:hypothetical protein
MTKREAFLAVAAVLSLVWAAAPASADPVKNIAPQPAQAQLI